MKCEDALRFMGAYVDDEADLATSEAIRGHLATCESCRREEASIRALRTSVAAAGRFTPSDALRAKLEKALPSQPAKVEKTTRPRWLLPVWGAGALAVAAALIFLLLIRPINLGRADLARQVVSNHVRSMMADHLLDVQSSSRHTVKPWFAGRVSTAATPYDLATEGFPLAGGRLDTIDNRPTETFIYRHGPHIINVFVLPTTTSPWSTDQQGFHLIAWPLDGLEYVAVSDMDESELKRFVEAFKSASR